MSKLILTVLEPTLDRLLDAIVSTSAVDGFEIRLDALQHPIDSLTPIRNVTRKELILTRRSTGKPRPFTAREIEQAIASGFDWVDVELAENLPIGRFADRVILSHHDFESTPDLSALYRRIKSIPAAKRKIATSATSFADNQRLLALIASAGDPDLTVIGMGSRGLYSRILAPFFGSELIFVARDEHSIAAPGQITIENARHIYGDEPLARPRALFAVVGNPVGHSRSPEIHNPGFRNAGVAAAYSMIEVERFGEVGEAMMERRPFAPTGISITAPFKEDAYRFARQVKAHLTKPADECRAVNTLVVFPDKIVADNTDVQGFVAGLSLTARRSPLAAVVGAGGAARAALLALRDASVQTIIYNRSREKAVALGRELGADTQPLQSLSDFHGDVIINALPADAHVDFPLSRDHLYIDVSYADGAEERIARAREAGMRVFDGLDFLRAQAVPQSELFIRAAREAR